MAITMKPPEAVYQLRLGRWARRQKAWGFAQKLPSQGSRTAKSLMPFVLPFCYWPGTTPGNVTPKSGGVLSPSISRARRGGSLLEPPRPRYLKVASQHFIDRAATPPNLGGEFFVIK